jgi:hypothetical protein
MMMDRDYVVCVKVLYDDDIEQNRVGRKKGMLVDDKSHNS